MSDLIVRNQTHYINAEEDPVFICEKLMEGTTEYEAGYRFVDGMGNCYTETGASHSGNPPLTEINESAIQPGVQYVNNAGKIIVLSMVNPSAGQAAMNKYKRGFNLTDGNGLFYNHAGEEWLSLTADEYDPDNLDRIIMTKTEYDAFVERSGLKHLEFVGVTLMEVIFMVDKAEQDAKLKVALGETYVNNHGLLVKIDYVIPEDDAYYPDGFRFVDTRGIPYTADGRTASDTSYLVRLYEEDQGMILQEGLFYRNHLHDVVLISSTIEPTSELFTQGFRVGDHRGTVYTAGGSVQSKIWGKLDLFEHVSCLDMTDEEIQKVHAQSDVHIRALDRADAITNAISETKRITRKILTLGFR